MGVSEESSAFTISETIFYILCKPYKSAVRWKRSEQKPIEKNCQRLQILAVNIFYYELISRKSNNYIPRIRIGLSVPNRRLF